MSQILNSVDAKKKLFSIKRLQASPKIVQEVIDLWKDPNTSMKEYQRVISKDPALTAEVMKVVNSPFYGLKNHVSNLRMALTMLGLRETYRIVSNRGFYKVFRTVFKDVKFNFNTFWQHCQTTANTAYALAGKFLPEQASEAYVAGLLHDVGRLTMAQFFPLEWEELMKGFIWQQDEGLDLEENIFGVTHAELGAVLLVRWNIPKEIVLPVRYHHDPFSATEQLELVHIVYYADKIATYLLSEVHRKEINEYFTENPIWLRMITKHPQMNLLADEKVFEEFKPRIFQQM